MQKPYSPINLSRSERAEQSQPSNSILFWLMVGLAATWGLFAVFLHAIV